MNAGCRWALPTVQRLTLMAMFVHLAAETSVAGIRRAGIGRLRRPREGFPGGIFAVPVTRNFYLSHQWLRELKQRHAGAIAGVYFRLPDDEQVWVGRYNQDHAWMTAAQGSRHVHGLRV